MTGRKIAIDCGKKFAQLVLIILKHVTSHKEKELLSNSSHVIFQFHNGVLTSTENEFVP
jgi:hypothetical protein